MKKLDMRGKACPIPVVEARKALASEDSVQVLVDNRVAVQNLEKMAQGKGYTYKYIQQAADLYAVTLRIEEGAPTLSQSVPTQGEMDPLPKGSGFTPGSGLTILIRSEFLGVGSEELGKILLKGYLFTLGELEPLPETLLFLNGGVKLACAGSNALADLQALEEKGVEIRVCGTCLNYYQLTESLEVGVVTDMMDISQRLASAARLITL